MNFFSEIFSQYLGDDSVRKILSDDAFIQKMILFETGLAKAQSRLGLIPEKAADEIIDLVPKIKINPADLAESTLKNGMPVLGLLSILKEKLSSDTASFLHYGATSQDAMDTAVVLMMSDAVQLFEERIQLLISKLEGLIKKYGHVNCMAHTRGQQAIPIRFENKINAWKFPLQRQKFRLDEIEKGLFIVQLGGAVGTLSVFPEKADELITELAKELNLIPSTSWNSQRDNFCEFSNWLAMLTGILGKMGADILFMAQTEIGEIIENENGGKSSAMPHKNNPVLSEALVALSRINANLQAQQLQSLVHINERDATAWILEWDAIPKMLINTGTSLNHAISIASNMKVDTEAMKKNIDAYKLANKK